MFIGRFLNNCRQINKKNKHYRGKWKDRLKILKNGGLLIEVRTYVSKGARHFGNLGQRYLERR